MSTPEDNDVFPPFQALRTRVCTHSDAPTAFTYLRSLPFDKWPLAVAYTMRTWGVQVGIENLPDLPRAIVSAPYQKLAVSVGVLNAPPEFTAAMSRIPNSTQVSDGQWKIPCDPTPAELLSLISHYAIAVTPEARAILSTTRTPPTSTLTPAEDNAPPVTTQPVELIADANGAVVFLHANTPQWQPAMKTLGATWTGNHFRVPASGSFAAAKWASENNVDISAEVRAAALSPLLTPAPTLSQLADIPLSDLSSVTDKKVENFAGSGITSIYDLLFHLPLRYVDRSTVRPVSLLSDGDTATVVGHIQSVNVNRANRLLTVRVADGTGGVMSAKFFNAMWRAKRLSVGDEVSIHGTVSSWKGQLSMVGPLMDTVEPDSPPVIPIYPQSAKNTISTWDIHRAVNEALYRVPEVVETIPDGTRATRELLPVHEALTTMHFPHTLDDVAIARRTLAYDELFRTQTVLLMQKSLRSRQRGIQHTTGTTGHSYQTFLTSLPFTLTDAQNNALDDIHADMASPSPMHRLLQGEVGSGKTLVALAAILTAIDSGHQAALMAPTEILARQLYDEFCDRTTNVTTANGEPLRVEFVTNKLRGKARDAARARLAEGTTHVAVGTHALLTDDIEFADLTLTVIDEQHRFGVEQRALLRGKSSGNSVADLLIMTATPIPRTATMTLFGDLSTTIIDTLPPGRSPIVTHWVRSDPQLSNAASSPWAQVRAEVTKGRQAFIVCPLVTESQKMEAAAAEETAAELQAGALSGVRVGVVHGQQKPVDRSAIMEAFRAGDLDVIVATTVIEVGVNVPNATMMVVLDAPRFGISQLHQLRGRVGRGSHQGTCVLVGDSKNPDTVKRLSAVTETTSGLKLAEMDWEIRGAGQIFGVAQSGAGDMRVADIHTDSDLLALAREDAKELLAADPRLHQHGALRDDMETLLPPHELAWLNKS